MEYYILDTETTGLKPDYHEISQISIIRVKDRYQLSKFIKIDYPSRVSWEALKATGRTLADLKKGSPKLEVIEFVESWLSEDGKTPEHRCMIAHKATFDRKFVYEFWKQYNKAFPAVCWLDTVPVAGKYLKLYCGIQKPKRTLHDALIQMGIKPKKGAHNAISDTQNLYIMHDFLIKQGMDLLPYIKRIPMIAETNEMEENDDA